MITLDPLDVLMETDNFVIQRSTGKAILKNEVKVIATNCKDCGKIRREDDVFIDRLCLACHNKAYPLKDPPDVPKVPERDSVEIKGSSFLKYAQWESPGKLILSLVNGRQIIYLDVPFDFWREFTQAKSTGKFYNERIKGVYKQDLETTG